ncbi:hypothetical protein [Vibrio algivorus]|uniref:Uncharacterized protein n=1 Tax=Vibrio algivorus TaxID=1667024 RepID=A0A557PFJ1_9VIBR|nr:hypothetical protein [Vibrio algivorus]TVO39435.1 hypothetical protein FOF44_02285 [Vibrio algivorus]
MKTLKSMSLIVMGISLLATLSTSVLAHGSGGSLGGANIDMCQSGAINCGYPARSHDNSKSLRDNDNKGKREDKDDSANKALQSAQVSHKANK